jgi:hypothetical protein
LVSKKIDEVKRETKHTARMGDAWDVWEPSMCPPLSVGLRGGARQLVAVVEGQLPRAAAEGRENGENRRKKKQVECIHSWIEKREAV